MIGEHAAAEEERRRPPPPPAPVPEAMPGRRQILALQQTLGNRAVGDLLARTRERRVARLLLDQATWTARTGGFDRAADAKLAELDTLIGSYATATTLATKRTALDGLDAKAAEWLSEHYVQRWTGTGLTPVLTQLRKEIAPALARLQSLEDSGYAIGPWAVKLLDDLAAGGLTDVALMNALFDALVTKLSGGFRYFSGGDPDWLDAGAQANCQNLSNGLRVLAAAAGLEVQTEVINYDFATKANTGFVSTHNGNVRFETEAEYTSKRFVFSMHVTAKYKGAYYDLTTRSRFAAIPDAIGWKLQDAGDRRLITEVTDGAAFPDGTASRPRHGRARARRREDVNGVRVLLGGQAQAARLGPGRELFEEPRHDERLDGGDQRGIDRPRVGPAPRASVGPRPRSRRPSRAAAARRRRPTASGRRRRPRTGVRRCRR